MEKIITVKVVHEYEVDVTDINEEHINDICEFAKEEALRMLHDDMSRCIVSSEDFDAQVVSIKEFE